MSFFYKNFMFFLLVLTTAVTPLIFSSSYERGESHNIKSGELYKTWHVNVTNGMSNNKILFLHCKSAQNDLGIQNLIVGNYSTWKFRPRIFGKTLFWCYMASDNSHAAFDVYWEDENFFYRCNWKFCDWIAKDNGIYLKNIPKGYDEFRHKWEPGRLY
ncbi:hypothetical protein E1A91_D08G234100v1 [Gossypium mustelinum]|uniref:S-protein homolog n=1 Tax=Gossypium mustelinum TaxID=34275 RepID=A0A5D2U0N5_GOSMU|nr:hypothetical protein E1A91_D08G234100v1 [Gossypium mustelinum]